MAKKQKTEGNPRSFKGWDFKVWAKKNSSSIKGLVLAVVALCSFFMTDWGVAASAAFTGVTTAASKLILDTFDYWISK